MQRCRFGETPDKQNELAALVVKDIKTATCSALVDYHERPDLLPHPGDRFVVENGRGEAVCVIETIDVQFIRFCDVDERHAWAEGEGDRMLANWRVEHQRYFEAEGTFAPDMTLVCETFKRLPDAAV